MNSSMVLLWIAASVIRLLLNGFVLTFVLSVAPMDWMVYYWMEVAEFGERAFSMRICKSLMFVTHCSCSHFMLHCRVDPLYGDHEEGSIKFYGAARRRLIVARKLSCKSFLRQETRNCRGNRLEPKRVSSYKTLHLTAAAAWMLLKC